MWGKKQGLKRRQAFPDEERQRTRAERDRKHLRDMAGKTEASEGGIYATGGP